MVLISVILLSYNHEKYLTQAIATVLNQTVKDFELIIIDDFSQDNSKKIIYDYQQTDERISAFFHKANIGIGKTMTEGLAKAKGEFVSFLDSDDVWLESKLERQLSVLSVDESLIVWTEGQIIDGNGVPTGETFSQLYAAQNKVKSGNLFEAILYKNFILGSSILFKREFVESIRFCEKLKYYNDYKFYVDLSGKYCFYFIAEALTKYRVHGKNTNSSDRQGWVRDELLFGNLVLREYGGSLSSRVKADLLLRVGSAYSFFGDKEDARKTIFEAMGVNPFRKDIFFYLFSALVNGDDGLAKFFVKLGFWFKRVVGSLNLGVKVIGV
jgi:glycosyltransferase involved in cell wall biosynthesis